MQSWAQKDLCVNFFLVVVRCHSRSRNRGRGSTPNILKHIHRSNKFILYHHTIAIHWYHRRRKTNSSEVSGNIVTATWPLLRVHFDHDISNFSPSRKITTAKIMTERWLSLTFKWSQLNWSNFFQTHKCLWFLLASRHQPIVSHIFFQLIYRIVAWTASNVYRELKCTWFLLFMLTITSVIMLSNTSRIK